MSVLDDVKNLAERVTDNVGALIDDRAGMLSEIDRLRERLMERDKETVKTMHDMRSELEVAQMEALRFKREWLRIKAKLQNLNDRLIALTRTGLSNRKKRCGG